MKEITDKTPQTLQTVLNKIIEEKGWDDQLAFSKIEAMWSEIVGEKIAGVVLVKSLIRGRLTLETESSTWRTEMTLRKDQIKEKINSLLNKELVEEIVIR